MKNDLAKIISINKSEINENLKIDIVDQEGNEAPPEVVNHILMSVVLQQVEQIKLLKRHLFYSRLGIFLACIYLLGFSLWHLFYQ